MNEDIKNPKDKREEYSKILTKAFVVALNGIDNNISKNETNFYLIDAALDACFAIIKTVVHTIGCLDPEEGRILAKELVESLNIKLAITVEGFTKNSKAKRENIINDKKTRPNTRFSEDI
ncbi:MAG: hypothetical protein ACTSQE_12370 [Candidatus Heimdallarchaeaceae archaeon]